MSYEKGPNDGTANLYDVLHSVGTMQIRRAELYLWNELMRQNHYLGLHSLVGESLRYIAIFQGHCLALLDWSAGGLKYNVRDQWIGWHSW